MNLIDTTELDKINKPIDFNKIEKDSFIDVNERLEKPPIAISIGERYYGNNRYDCEFATFGNFSCIVGASKSKKTFLKSLVIGSFIGGDSAMLAPDIKSHRTKDMFMLDFDTEQSKWHSQRVFKRVGSIAGQDYKFYKPFYLRKYTHKERLQFVEYMILESQYKDNIGLVNIDGFADLVSTTNNEEECSELVEKMMKWTELSKCHLTGILHANPNSTKPRGHLGSYIMRKAETVCLLSLNEQDKEVTDVSFPYTRGFPIDNFSFSINDEGLPVVDNQHFI